jgi:hypothetical protein
MVSLANRSEGVHTRSVNMYHNGPLAIVTARLAQNMSTTISTGNVRNTR